MDNNHPDIFHREFKLDGVGSVTAGVWTGDLLPHIEFAEGGECVGIKRTLCEVRPLGYETSFIANFEHEAAHLFTSWKCGFLPDSILRREADGKDISACPVMLGEAGSEERIVLGVQIAARFAMSDRRPVGFHLHLAEAAIENARRRVVEEFGVDFDALVREFIIRLENGGKVFS